MSEIRKTAVKIQQGDLRLYLTSFTARDFLQGKPGDFYRVDRLDVAKGDGMQRLLEKQRIKNFATDMLAAKAEALLPTSVFLATEGDIEYHEDSREIVFDSSPKAGVCPFDVVDGQHRIEGLRAAINRVDGHELRNFPVPTVIATNLNEVARMLQFIVVNAKQEKVGSEVAQHIISRFTKMDGIEDLPYIPSWLHREIEKGAVHKALEFTKRLNRDSDSLLCGRIQMGDERKTTTHTVNQKSFIRLFSKFVLVAGHPLSIVGRNFNHSVDILKNFWGAIDAVFVGEYSERTNVYKANSIEFFLQILGPVLNQLAKNKQAYTVDDFKNCILSAGDYLHVGEYAGALFPEYWKTGGVASGLNAGGMRKFASAFNQALANANNSQNIEI